jgi:hypothetical protein
MQRREKIERMDYSFVVLQCTGEKLKPLITGNAARPIAFKMNSMKLDDLPVIWRG